MSVHISWGTKISERIPVQCGTKQGGLTSPFTTIPRWYINGVSLDIEDKLTYLGSILGENGDKEHCENRCRTAHYKTVPWLEMLNTYYGSHEGLRN